MTIREISHDEYLAGLQDEIQKDGLIEAVKKRLDEINHEALTLSYAECGLIQEKSVEIIDLLKAQEPRVMTRAEIENADGYVWMENPGYSAMSVRLIRDGMILEPFQMTKNVSNLGWDSYGKRWRCWSLQPTDLQREGTPWK